ncbi:NurA domain-containing protein [Nitrosopumilaceae archaeon]|nr:hypothetical protein [Nitrosopumilus sp.]MDA7954869.1 hypothetical protein [Nitrosopumilus sp.]MDA7973909.1 hypothetical protein [Nitrosopumilus sp.]MDA7996875.1 hypothetical protein [Nitrosopumilus sp.]CAI9832308.1 NurA domain-containing protein [Nitrosopumilaceae archaeon]
MSEHPVRDLVEDLGGHLGSVAHVDRALTARDEKSRDITPRKFRGILDVDDPARMAFIDGGEATLEESSNFMVTLNRIYFSMFRGGRRIAPAGRSRVQFFASVTSSFEPGGSVRYGTRIYPHRPEDAAFLPDAATLSYKSTGQSMIQGSRITSLGRRFAEWRLARHVVESELERGDMLVMDGSLQANFDNEKAYANALYAAAMSKGVTLCGLSKTSRLVTRSGEHLLTRISEVASGVTFGRWYVEVAEETEPDNKGFVLATKLHPRSAYTFRFEVLRDQYNNMSWDQRDHVLGSIAANSNDVAMLGYPYGLIDADRFAQVRNDELGLYKGYLDTEMMRHPDGRKMLRHSAANGAHGHLNGVTS